MIILALVPGCGLILGGDQHVDSKSHDYMVVRLDQTNEWRALVAKATSDLTSKSAEAERGEALPSQDAGDVAFEHKKTGSVISVNSVCNTSRDASLEELSRYLLRGLNTRGSVETENIRVDGETALQSTVEAGMVQRQPSGENEEYPVRVRAVVMRKSGCTYDLMYIARPSVFKKLLPSFDQFLAGFHAP